jgi:5-formyltetrahydrofolate cyclo-ligase
VESAAAVEEVKALLRRRIRAERAARHADERERAALGLRDIAMSTPAVATARIVTCFLSAPTEPGTAPLRLALQRAGLRVLLPVVASSGPQPTLDWALDDGTSRSGTYLGLPEPTGPRLGQQAIATADLVLVPALAVDTTGARLGQGGGFYDRALTMVRDGALVVAVLHDEELLDAAVEPVPVLPHDRHVDAVLTPSRWVTISVTGSASPGASGRGRESSSPPSPQRHA